MKHNSIKKDIFIILKKEPYHQRELARKLNTNQTNIRRALIFLENENIIDKREVGKSKVYFIKESKESLVYERIVENYKLMSCLEKPKLRKIFGDIQDKIAKKRIGSETIILVFGSYAKNLETEESDIDIYINSKNKSVKKEIEEISENIQVVSGDIDNKSELFKEIKRDHIILNNVEGFLNLLK